MPKVFTSKSQKIGEIGEDIACKFLVKQGFDIIERNFTRKCGEIDIVAKKNKKIHFIEVKSVSRENLNDFSREVLHLPEFARADVKHQFRPEENMHPIKAQKMARTIEVYLSYRNISTPWQADLLCVYLNIINKQARVKVMQNIIL